MRLLGKCAECGDWFVEELGPTTPERVERLTREVPLWPDTRHCGHCLSSMRRNDSHWFFEEFTSISEMGISSERFPPP